MKIGDFPELCKRLPEDYAHQAVPSFVQQKCLPPRKQPIGGKSTGKVESSQNYFTQMMAANEPDRTPSIDIRIYLNKTV